MQNIWHLCWPQVRGNIEIGNLETKTPCVIVCCYNNLAIPKMGGHSNIQHHLCHSSKTMSCHCTYIPWHITMNGFVKFRPKIILTTILRSKTVACNQSINLWICLFQKLITNHNYKAKNKKSKLMRMDIYIICLL